MKCTVGLEEGQLTGCTQALLIFPACLLACLSLIHDLTRLIRPSKRSGVILKLYTWVSAPFEPFLRLEDFEEYEGASAKRVSQPRWKTRVVIAACLLHFMADLALLGLAATENPIEPIALWSAIVSTVIWIIMSTRLILQRPSSPPYAFLAFSFLSLVTSTIVVFYEFGNIKTHPLPQLSIIRVLASITLIATFSSYPMEDVSPAPNVAPVQGFLSSPTTWVQPTITMSSPEDSVSLWNWMTFDFMEPMLRLSGERTLNDEDVWDLPPGFKHANLFKKYLEAEEHHPNMSLIWFLVSYNSRDLLIDIALRMWTSVIGFVPPYALARILSSLEQKNPPYTDAYIFAFVALLAHLSFAQFDLLQGWHSRRAYERTRGVLWCLLHWKALSMRDTKGKVEPKVNSEQKIESEQGTEEKAELSGIGRITNLMSGDAYAVSQRFWEFSAVFTAPVKLAIALVFLYKVLGWSSFAGVAVVLLAYLITWPLARWSIQITRSSWAAKDKRMALVNELIQSVRFLKYMGWESYWTGKVKKARESELGWRVKENIVSSIIAFIWTWIPSAVVLVAFSSYTTIAGEPLTVSKAFVSIEIFSQLQGPMAELPNQIFALLHAYVSMQRIEKYLGEEEVEPWATAGLHEQIARLETTEAASRTIRQANASDHTDHQDGNLIGFQKASFRWHASPVSSQSIPTIQVDPPPEDAPISPAPDSTFILSNLNISFPLNRLSLVTGPTGSGKSSLLAALLGEMTCVAGTVHISKYSRNVAYSGQSPFLEHATIRENIVYHSKFQEERYKAVIEACALIPDLKVLDAGDMTEIGEKGVSLSGGQRARIALARAIYSQSQVVLLDDPLAAVDMHTAKHLFTHCLSSEAPLMRGRTVILVTHHVSLCLPATAYLVELSHGRVLHAGTVEDLRDRGILARVIEVEDVTPSADVVQDAPATTAVNDADTETPPGELSNDLATGKLVEDETRAEGRVSLSTYLTYVRAAGWSSWILSFFLLILLRALSVGAQLFIAKWAQAYRDESSISRLMIMAQSAAKLTGLPSPSDNVTPWLLIYLGISVGGALTTLLFIIVGYYSGLRASRKLFISMLDRVVRAPTRIFDTTPVGRILNRFVADIGAVDNAINSSARTAMSGVLAFLISFGVVVYVVPRFTPFAIFIAYLYIRIAPPFVRTARDLRRLESISLSPVFAGFDELLHGLVHVRAFSMELVYQNRFYRRVDRAQAFDHVYWLAQMWLRYRYDVLGSVVVYLTTLFALLSGVNEGLAAIVIIQAGVFAEASRQLVKVLAQAELDFNSVERIKEYLQLPQEAPVRGVNPPPAAWPSSSGGIRVEELVIRYAPHLPPVLKGISFDIKPREKIGVVGRTGSGKSTLALAMLRIIEAAEGKIFLDDIDISSVGLDDLRTRVTIVSQDVALFAGSVKSNLDPLGEHTEAECWDVLERCHLTSSRLPVDGFTPALNARTGVITSLDMPVSSGGASFSAGERQLLALARAMLRRSSFVILDEASSSIDLATDDQIQRTIREELADSLVLTIAHRLKTILDYDRILVLGEGRILEYDSPSVLFNRVGSVFREMCEKSADWEELKQLIGEELMSTT